jgi:hypothetical protein
MENVVIKITAGARIALPKTNRSVKRDPSGQAPADGPTSRLSDHQLRLEMRQ